MIRKRQRRRPMALQTTIISQVLLIMIIAAFGPLASARPSRTDSDEYFRREREDGILDRSGNSKQHSRRGISHPANNSPLNLQETLHSFKELQRTLSESVLFIDESGADSESGAEDPEISYEIEPIPKSSSKLSSLRDPSLRESTSVDDDDERSPVASASRLRGHHGGSGRGELSRHKLRHGGRGHRQRHSKKDETDSGNLVDTDDLDESPSSRIPYIRVNANLHKTSSGARSSSERGATRRTWRNSMERSANSVHDDAQSDGSFSGILPLHHDRGCPKMNGKALLMCPSTSKKSGYNTCIAVDKLCDRKNDCPGGEDENPVNCLFYKTTMGHFKKVVDAVISLADHMVIAEKTHHEL